MKRIITLLFAVISAIAPGSVQSQVIWSEDFSEGQIPQGWENEDSNGDGQILWQPCSDPLECPPYLFDFGLSGLAPFVSPSAENGYVFVAPGSFGGDFLSSLTTESIDCSAYSSVFIQFYAQIGTNNLSAAQNATLRVQAGGEWHSFSIFPGLTSNGDLLESPCIVSLDISHVAAGEASVRIQWQWRGKNELFWAIDDVVLSYEDPAAPFGAVWFERFPWGFEGWELNSLSPGGEVWEWDPAGDVSKGLTVPDGTRIKSTTAGDGAMVFNSDYYTTEGSIDNLPVNPPYPSYVSELISPVIDLAEVENPVSLHFTQLVQVLNPAPDAPVNDEGNRLITSFSISTNGGQSWSVPIDVNPYLEPNTASNPVAPLHSTEIVPLPPLAGEASVRLKFTWAGDFYYWVLDDIAIVERPDYDMKANQNFYAVMPNAMTPRSQLEEEAFLADVTNVGAQAASGVFIELSVTHDASDVEVYRDTNLIGTVEVDELVENVVFNRRLTPGDLTEKGFYTGIYRVGQEGADAFPQNDSIRWRFEITDTTFAKELGPTRNITASETTSFSYGNCFFVPNGEGWFARYITFGVANASALEGRSVNIYLYKWQGDLNNDQKASPDEYIGPIGLNTYTFDGSEDGKLITIPVDLDGAGIPLEDDSYYLALVEYVSQNNQRCFFLASQKFNYQATWFLTDSLARPRYANVLDLGNTGVFNLVGFGLDIVPVVRLHIGQTPDISEPPTSAIFPSNNLQMEVFPNPGADIFQVIISPGEPEEYFSLKVFNSIGRTFFQEIFRYQQEKIVSFNASNWPKGIYFIELRAGRKVQTQKLILN